MHTLTIVLIIGFLGLGLGESLVSQSPRVLRTSTPCIATQTFLNELRKMLLESEGRKQKDTASGSGGAVYTRWGRKDCPSGSHLVYTGSAGGSHYTHKGGSANTLCLPKEPEYASYTTSHHRGSYIYGTEYRTTNQLSGFNHLNLQDVPCAVCETQVNQNILMIPARKSCPHGWHLEYTGYLMGGHYNHYSAVDYLCVDRAAQPLHNGHENKEGHLFYLVEGQCGPLPCPPYRQNRELTCVVCSH